MGGARALIASLGASISVVAAVAVSLLFFSVVFALPGLTGGNDAPGASAAVVVESKALRPRQTGDGQVREAADAVVISAPARARSEARPAGRASVAHRVAARRQPSFNPGLRDLSPPPASAPEPATPAPSKPALGDGVRGVGDVVTATVQSTGAAAGQATAQLLGPPVSKVVQEVLDLLSSVLQGATSALGGALDNVPR